MEVVISQTIRSFSQSGWNELTGDDNPFIEYEFLELLETSKSVGVQAGWIPFYITVQDEDTLRGALFVYLKDHSYGEYIFDWAFAQAAEQIHVPYYPKLVCAVPFTPATGPRFLVPPGKDKDRIRSLLLSGLLALQKDLDAQSIHFLYALDDEVEFLNQNGFFRRASHQFHWRNPGYETFDQFLQSLKSRNRKQIVRERRKMSEGGLELELRRGDTLSDAEWNDLYRFYSTTIGRKWGSPYLTRQFFEGAKESLGDRSIIGFARHNNTPIAGTLSFQKGNHLYGRYWGATHFFDGLHFELCYYQLQDFAIQNKLRLVEAGAQGEHKIKRGFVPVVTHSAHWFANPKLELLIGRFLEQELRGYENEMSEWRKICPFKDDTFPDFPLKAGVPI
jgi:uncharacterized protein